VDRERPRGHPRRGRRYFARSFCSRDGRLRNGVVGPSPLRRRGRGNRFGAYAWRHAAFARGGEGRGGRERRASARGVCGEVPGSPRVDLGARTTRRLRCGCSFRVAVLLQRISRHNRGPRFSRYAEVGRGRRLSDVGAQRLGNVRSNEARLRHGGFDSLSRTSGRDSAHQRPRSLPLRKPGLGWDPNVDPLGVLLRRHCGGASEPRGARGPEGDTRAADAHVRGCGCEPEEGVAAAAPREPAGEEEQRDGGGANRQGKDDGDRSSRRGCR
jgi:hypothetical protein